MKKINKIMIMGYKRHGKDTFCEILEEKYGFKFASSSEFACELFLFDILNNKYGMNYSTPKEAFEDRGNHRKIWYEEIKEYNVENGLDALGNKIFEDHDGYCGIRDNEEFDCLKKNKAFDFSVWIDADKRLPPESEESNKLNKSMADFVIDNNGTLKELEIKAETFYKKIILEHSYVDSGPSM